MVEIKKSRSSWQIFFLPIHEQFAAEVVVTGMESLDHRFPALPKTTFSSQIFAHLHRRNDLDEQIFSLISYAQYILFEWNRNVKICR